MKMKDVVGLTDRETLMWESLKGTAKRDWIELSANFVQNSLIAGVLVLGGWTQMWYLIAIGYGFVIVYTLRQPKPFNDWVVLAEKIEASLTDYPAEQ